MTTTIMCWRGRETERESSASSRVASRRDSPWLHRLDQEENSEIKVEKSSQHLHPDYVSIQQRVKSASPRRGNSPSAMDGLKTLTHHDPPSSPSFNIHNMVKESCKNIDHQAGAYSRPNSSGKMLQLTPVWEQVVKNQRVPPDINKEIVFSELSARLRDLEWQVRQHALRVLADIIPVVDSKNGELDMYMKQIVLSDIVNNLGHSAPSVRKGALDTLRIYLKHSADPESVLRSVINHGLERSTTAGTDQGNIAMGVILCTPTLLFPLVSSQSGTIISQDGLSHLLSALSKKLVQISFQEQALKAMVKIKDMIGESRFNRFLDGFHPQCKKDFDILCQVYEVQSSLGDSGIDLQLVPSVDDYQLLKEASEDLMDNGYGYWSEDSSVLSPPEIKLYSSISSSYNNNTLLSSPIDFQGRVSPRIETKNEELEDQEMDDEGVSQEYNDDEDFDSDRETSSEENTEEDVEVRLEEDRIDVEEEYKKSEQDESFDRDSFQNDSVESSKEERDVNESIDTEENVLQSGKVILETEIKFNEQTAITMTILEEDKTRSKGDDTITEGTENQCENDDESSEELVSEIYNNDFVMKVLTEDEDDDQYYYDEDGDIQPVRRTPRRVRFGGEMVMMRTPDSDSANDEVLQVTTSEDTTTTITDTSTERSSSNDTNVGMNNENVREPVGSKARDQTEINQKSRVSQIPLPVSPARHQPRELRKGGPVFKRQKKTERPPSANDERENDTEKKKEEKGQGRAITSRPDLKKKYVVSANNNTKKPTHPQENRRVPAIKVEDAELKSEKLKPESKIIRQETRSPIKEKPEIRKESSTKQTTLVPLSNVDSGDSFTSSSSESDYYRNLETTRGRNWEDLGIVSWSVVNDIYNKDDWCVRVKGIEQLSLSLHHPENLSRVQPCLPSLLHCLLVTLAEDKNYKVATSAISVVRSLIFLLQRAVLRQHLSQIVTGLVRHVGGNGCVNIKIEAAQAAKALMQAVRPGNIMDILLSSNCIHAKSSKMRENSLLFVIYAIHTFPSTEFDWEPIAEKVVHAVADPRRRVRQAALDALAVLAQFVPPRMLDRNILDAADRQRLPDQRAAFMNAVQARLARRQLPVISPDGLVLYALQIPPSRCNSSKSALTGSPAGPDVDWILSGSGSVSSGSARSRGQLMAAQRVEQSTSVAFSSSDASVFLGRQRESVGSSHTGSINTRNPWTERRAQELVAVGVGIPHSIPTLPRVHSAIDPHGRQPNNQVTWALVPVSAVQQHMEEQKQRVPSLWSSDIQEVGPSSGAYRPVYLRFHTGPDAAYTTSDKGVTFVSNRSAHSRGGGNTRAQEYANQTWPPQSSTSARGRNAAPRVLTPSQHRGRRILEPINSPHSNIRDASPVHEDTLPRLTPPVSSRSAINSGVRRKIPPLSPHKQNLEDEGGPTEPLKPIMQDEPEDYLKRSSRNSSRPRNAEKSPTKPKSKRRQRVQPERRNDALDEDRNPEQHGTVEMYRLNSPIKYKQTPPILVDSAPGKDCSIPQKPVLVRQNLRNDVNQGGRPPSGSLFTPPAEPFLPPVEPVSSHTQTRSPFSPSHHQEDQDELDFRSLESLGQEEATDNHSHSQHLHSQMLSSSYPHARSYGGILEAEERAHKFQQLRDQEEEAVAISPHMPSSAPAAIDASMTNEPRNGSATSRTEFVDLSSTDLTKSSTSVDEGSNGGGNTYTISNSSADNEEPPRQIKTLAATPPHIIDLQLNINENDVNRQEDMAVTTAPLKRTKKSIDSKQLGNKIIGRGLNGGVPRESLRSRGGQQKSNTSNMFNDNLRPLDKPRDALQQCFHQLESMEWEVVMQGLQTLVRLTRHHPEIIQSQQHSVLVALAKQVRNLRSQVSRAACQAAGELFLALRRSLESDLDEIVTPLFHRSADTNKFLRSDSNAALDKMVEVISPSRAVTAIVSKGAMHQNAVVRTAAARLLLSIVSKLGVERTMALPRETRDKLLLTGANLLMEGSLDTRCFAKQMFRTLSQHPHFSSVINDVIPPHVLRNIMKTLQSLKNRP